MSENKEDLTGGKNYIDWLFEDWQRFLPFLLSAAGIYIMFTPEIADINGKYSFITILSKIIGGVFTLYGIRFSYKDYTDRKKGKHK